MAIGGVSRYLSLTTAGSLTKASFGAVSGVVVEVTHSIPSGFIPLVATQPAGSAGATTPSKFCANAVLHGPAVGVGDATVAVGVAVAVDVAVAVAVGVTVAVAVGVGLGGTVAVAVGVGDGVAGGPVMVMRPST